MKRSLLKIAVPAVVVLATACGGGETPPGGTTSTPPPASSPSSAAAAAVPEVPTPTGEAPCPYLDRQTVEQSNGQRVGRVEVSAGEPHPACFFYTLDGKEVQLSVWVYTGAPESAKAVVDRAAPIATSSAVDDQPPGWNGGYQKTDEELVYAVGKAGTAVVVTTNQGQSIKTREIVKDVVAELGL